MKCETIRQTFTAYLDNSLPQEDVRLIEKHLSGCVECREELELLKSSAAALSSVLDEMAVPGSSMEEFLAACAVAAHPGRLASFVDWLTAPKRAVAATITGSLALTSALMLLAWLAVTSIPIEPSKEPRLFSPELYARLTFQTEPASRGEWENGL